MSSLIDENDEYISKDDDESLWGSVYGDDNDDSSTCDIVITKFVNFKLKEDNAKVKEEDEDLSIVYEDILESNIVNTVGETKNHAISQIFVKDKMETDANYLEIIYEKIQSLPSISSGTGSESSSTINSGSQNYNIDYLSLDEKSSGPKKQMVDESTVTDKPYKFKSHKKFYNQKFNGSSPYSKFNPYKPHSSTHFDPNRFEMYRTNSYYNHYQNQPYYNGYKRYNHNKPWHKNRWMPYMLQDHQFKMMLFQEYYMFTKFLEFYQYNMGY